MRIERLSVKRRGYLKPMRLSLFVVTCVCLGLFLAHTVAYAESVPVEIEKLTVRPLDTIDAERVRIWIPIEGAYTCAVKVHIFDSTGKEVRQFLNTLLQKGYHNFYWDKRDSMGNYVSPGVYSYKSITCGTVRTGKLEAVYTQWERDCKVTVYDSSKPPEFVIETNRDSITMSLTVFFGRGRVADRIMRDTLLMSGIHRFQWVPKINLPPGLYRLSYEIGEYKSEVAFRYQP